MLIKDNLHWVRIYWVKGGMPKGNDYRNSVKDPPCSGWGHAFVIKGEKRSTIFCPYSLTSYTVRTDCDEIAKADTEPRDGFQEEWMIEYIQKSWAQHQARGWQSAYDVAAKVLIILEAEVPEQIQKGGEVDERRKGGKPPELHLLKPVKLKSKRGVFLKWFADNDYSGSIRGAMIEFDMTRSNALSYLHAINKDHGLGYELLGDNAVVTLPAGCDWPFDADPPTEDDWLDGEPEPADEEEWLA